MKADSNALQKVKRPLWEGVGATKGYPAEQMFLVMVTRRSELNW